MVDGLLTLDLVLPRLEAVGNLGENSILSSQRAIDDSAQVIEATLRLLLELGLLTVILGAGVPEDIRLKSRPHQAKQRTGNHISLGLETGVLLVHTIRVTQLDDFVQRALSAVEDSNDRFLLDISCSQRALLSQTTHNVRTTLFTPATCASPFEDKIDGRAGHEGKTCLRILDGFLDRSRLDVHIAASRTPKHALESDTAPQKKTLNFCSHCAGFKSPRVHASVRAHTHA